MNLGCLEPNTELKGVQSRLTSLGYSTLGEELFGEQTRQSIKNFQADFDLEPTGELSEQTRNKIKEIFGA